MSNIINIEEMAARTKLAVLQTGAWRATRQHRTETDAENKRHNTNAAKVLVRVSDHPALAGLTKLHAAAYQEHKRLTLPTIQDGMRLLPAGREFEHSDRMRKLADRHDGLVAEFLADYESERESAPVRLNGLYDASMWPSLGIVKNRFVFQTRYLPTPVTSEWRDWFAASAEEAERELHDRLTEALTRVRDRCASNGKLYASVFDAIRDLTDLVPDFDLSGSYASVVAAMAPLSKVNAEDIRDSSIARTTISKQAGDILSVLDRIK